MIRELNIVRWWHGRVEAIGMAFLSLVFEKVSQNYCRTTETPEERRSGDKEGRWKRKGEVILSTRSHRVTFP